MHQMVDVSEFDNEYRPDLQLYHELCQGNSDNLKGRLYFSLFCDRKFKFSLSFSTFIS